MKIIYEEKPVKSFHELENGTIFIHDDREYMKMDEINFVFNAVFLGDGAPVHFDDYEKVRVCSNAVLTIK